MRLASMAILASLFAAPAMAGDLGAANMFGRDPGSDIAYACFSTTFDEGWLKAHPDQNVSRITVFVARRTGEDAVWHSGNMEMHFRDSAATYQVSADCSNEGTLFSCGIDCDGGGYQMSAISKSELTVLIDGYLRYYDIAEQPSGQTTAGFKGGDKALTVHRTALQDCLPLVADDEIRAKIARGELTQ
jgi:hypothetical protein